MRIQLTLQRTLSFILVLVSGFLQASPCHADLCEYYRKHRSKFAHIVCPKDRDSSPTGDAYSSFSAAFNINPASTPTEPSPYGLESIASLTRSANPAQNYTFSLIKGFHKIGTAVSTAGNLTFFGNDVAQRISGTVSDANIESSEAARGYGTSLNLGTAFALGSKEKPDGFATKLGFSLRYNQITNTLGPGAGISATAGRWIFGIGVAKEKISNFLPEIYFYSAVAGVKLTLIEVEYTFLENQGGADLKPIHILTFTTKMGRSLLSTSVRRLDYLNIGDVTQWHSAIQIQVNQNLAIGYLYNYIPGTNSLALQVFL